MEKAFKSTERSIQRRTNRPYVLVAIMLAMFMAAVEATVVSTAMPAIVAEIGGFSKYSWIFSSYLLMNAVTVLIYGKLSDIFGRKPVLIFGIVSFLIGSILCGISQSMDMLILYRFIQGFGAGAVMPIASTIVGDIYTTEERAKVQGYLSSVWGISAICGPILGGLLVEYVSWRFVFWINIPFGFLAIIGLVNFLHEQFDKKKVKIDYLGATYLFLAISAIMIVLVEGGVRFSWTSLPILSLTAIFLLFIVIFVFHERRVHDPMMPFALWKERSILFANLTSWTTGIILIGISSFLPTYVQGVMGKSPMIAGFTLTTMSIGWPIASTIAGRLVLNIGFRKTSTIGGLFLILGAFVFYYLSADDGPVMAMFGSFLIGVGMGLSTTSFIVLIQSSVDWSKRGIATATNMFMRTLGSTVGAALLGGILNNRLSNYLQSKGEDIDLSLNAAHSLLNPSDQTMLSPEMKEILNEGLNQALHQVYISVLIFAIISFLLILFLPQDKKV